jgi:hypothetical protein
MEQMVKSQSRNGANRLLTLRWKNSHLQSSKHRCTLLRACCRGWRQVNRRHEIRGDFQGQSRCAKVDQEQTRPPPGSAPMTYRKADERLVNRTVPKWCVGLMPTSHSRSPSMILRAGNNPRLAGLSLK